MEQMEAAAEKVGLLLNAEIEMDAEKCIIKRERLLEIQANNACFDCTLELDISFGHFKEDGSAINQAEILLLPEELPAFTFALSEHRIPFPTDYQQWQVTNPNIVSICIESTEPPEHFAERLSAALQVIEQ